ncbi:MAG: adenylosuccinate synthase [Lachnospiraceae bacterium]|nr:adenylosuccinate synthase [Lachnospiraceae bacterium]MBP3296306.1 adenylosuccinate synthase [Lachnospiraceae bacterium]MCR5129646.1 adenylosuccinate synthase [Lachnospiraceae bacterium]
MVKAVVGANWGDEGKGKITDMLAENADIVVRFQGGANAGHTIKNSYGKFALHTLPSGVFYDHTTSVIGNGVALNVPKFFEEVKSITSKGVPMPKIMISDRAQVVMPYHILFDEYEEERLKGAAFGSTKSGIAPFYSDKFAKIGFQVNELFEEESILRDKINRVIVQKNVLLEHLYHKPLLKEDEIFDTLMEYKKMVEPYVGDVSAFLCRALKEGKTVLLEGQLGTLKDTDHGIYPMVTSSNTIAAYGAVGAGVPPYEIKQIVTVVKAYSSSVGGGDFVSEIHGAEADELRNRGGDGGEFGATTGRPRRVGWFDCVASKYGCRLQGTTDVAFTVLDVLGYLDEIPVCVGYEIDGEETTDFPVTRRLAAAKPVWKKMPGWKSDIRGIRKYEELPENCRKYIEFVEEQIGYPITMISNGPAREDIIYRESPLKK